MQLGQQLATWSDLTAGRIAALVPAQSDEFDLVWPGVLKAAHLLWGVQGSSRDSLEDAWSLMFFAAGNFKRQGGTQIQLPYTVPASMSELEAEDRPTMCSFPLRDEIMTIDRDDPETWRILTDIRGISVATATTILSALWPGNHLIADVRDVSVAIALNWEMRADDWRLPKNYPQDATWNWYQWLRDLVRNTAADLGLSPVLVERSLYFLDKSTNIRKGSEWPLYIDRVSSQLLSMPA